MERLSRLLVWAVLLAGVFLRIRFFLADRSFWVDPAMLALNVARRSTFELLERLDWNQSAPWGFLLLSKLVGSTADYSERSLLLVPLAFSLGALFLFLRLTGMLLAPRWQLAAFAPFSLSSTAIYYAGEFKQYSCDPFFAVALLLAIVGALPGAVKPRAMATLLGVGLAAPWFSHASTLVLVACLLVLNFSSRKEDPERRGIVAISGFLALYVTALYWTQTYPNLPVGAADYHALAFPPMASPATFWAWIVAMVRGYFQYPLQLGSGWIAILVAVAAGVSMVLGRKAPTSLSEPATFVLRAAGLTLCFLLVASIFRLYPLSTGSNDVNARFVLFSLPLVTVALGILLARLERRWRTLATTVAMCSTLGAVSAAMAARPVVREEMRPLVAQLGEVRAPGDSIYVYHYAVPAFDFYLRSERLDYFAGTFGIPPAEDLRRILSMHPDLDRLWVVVAHDYEGARSALRALLSSEWKRIRKRSWPGASMELWVRRGTGNEDRPPS
jgi:hypothetical protein